MDVAIPVGAPRWRSSNNYKLTEDRWNGVNPGSPLFTVVYSIVFILSKCSVDVDPT